MNYKDTLLMPKTDFEMKGKLPSKEPKIQAMWKELNIAKLIADENRGNKQFVLHDGPPYANGNIHVGHALNKAIKDIIVRSKSIQGYYSPYTPGWDTHGLPIETAIAKSGVDRKKMSVAEFRKLCEEYAFEQIARQSEQFQRTGSLGFYDDPYITLTPDYEAEQIRIFGKMALDGLIYRGFKPVYWSPSSETALAEGELEYHDKEDSSVYIKFTVLDGKGLLEEGSTIMCWTTMPWTITTTVAVSVGKDIEYGLYEMPFGKALFAKKLAQDVFEKTEMDGELIKEFKGSELEFITASNPYNDRSCPVVFGDHVTTSDGTGCVTTSPGHGTEDFIVGQKYNLELLIACDQYGKMNPEMGEEIAGVYWEKANGIIIEKMKSKGTLVKALKLIHSYPYDWRTKKPIIFRATEQWFASIDKKRAELLEQIDNVKWTPSWGHIRLHNMISERGDWCISRQRAWGVPIPIIYDENKEPLIEKEIFDFVASKFEEYGSNYWFEAEVKDLLPPSYLTRENVDQYTKETDIMDVWFDSGSSHSAGAKVPDVTYPYELYMEGSDQYRGFFNSSLIVGTCYKGVSPYKEILSHGFVLDGNGNKMSKSLGNTVDPLKLMDQYGADVFRYWVASVDYQSDVRISDEAMKQVSDAYRKVRNTFKFMLGNLNNFTDSMLLDYSELADVDKYLMIKLNKLVLKVQAAYESYEFISIYNNINNFLIKELSAFYMDFTKDILYILKEDDKRRRQVQTVLYHCLESLIMMLAPILPHTMEETYSFLPKLEKRVSVHLERYPEIVDYDDEELEIKFDKFMKHRDDILKAIEVARAEKVIGKSLEASIKVSFKEGYEFIKDIPDLHQLYIVSNVDFEKNETAIEYDTAYLKVEKFDGYTCPRCWNVVSEDRVINDLCDRCDAVLNK